MEARMYRSTRIFAVLMPFILMVVLPAASHPVDAETIEKVIFGVSRSDTAQQTLEKLEGVKKVYAGFRDFLEIDTVYYDPDLITVRRMEDALKEAGVYRETLHDIPME
jgi:hypothetical protein